MFSFIINRLREPSTWAGLSAALVGAAHLAPALADPIAGAAAAVAGLVAAVLQEKGALQ